MVSAVQFAEVAERPSYNKIKYEQLDCQGFVEKVLYDAGCRKPDGAAYNWKGSNSMWRNALSWKGTIEQARTAFGSIPLGAWVFIVRNDGGEKEKGYTDKEGNATHVGIYCRNEREQVRDSTKTSYRNGVGYRELNGFTHVGIPSMINFSQPDLTKQDALIAVNIIRNSGSTDSAFLEAMETLTKYLIGG